MIPATKPEEEKEGREETVCDVEEVVEEVTRREVVGAKRKAEVLSKESGKIGVTITTSPPHSQPKLPRIGSPQPPVQVH